MGLFIDGNKLENLKLYKYSAEDHSIISKLILKKWWNSFVEIFPLSMAPNAVTLLGLGFILLNLLCVFYYDPFLDEASPRWCYFFYAFGLFMYQTFDGCDGCHARRTGHSGPLGELFDHSVDAINTTLGTIVFGSVFNLGYGWLFLIAQFASVCNFYTSTWEEYHTHTLYLSEFSGPVEGILMICGCFILTGIFGRELWSIKLFELDLSSIGYSDNYVIDTSSIIVVLGLGSLYFNISSAMANVNKKYASEHAGDSSKAKTVTLEAYKGLIPFFGYYATIVLFVVLYPEIISQFGFPLVISIGCSIAFSVGRIILAHLMLQSFPMVQYPMFMPLVQLFLAKVLISVYGYDYYKVLGAVSWLGCGITLGIHAFFITEIISEITSYLDIYALTIKHKRA